MNASTLKELNSDYPIATNRLRKLLAGKFSSTAVDEMLSLDNILIISDFLSQYNRFSKEDILKIEAFINGNLNHRNKLFLSDLIAFADGYGLNIPYEKCISYLQKFKGDNTYVQLAAIDYIFNKVDLRYWDEIAENLMLILSNKECNQSVQVKAAFFLFRMTYKKQYLTDLLDLVINGDDNKLLLHNLLKHQFNSAKHFEYHNVLSAVL